MRRRYEDAFEAAAERIAGAERDTRRRLVEVDGEEENFSAKFMSLFEERLDGFEDGGVSWRVATYLTKKQSGQETALGADMLIAIRMLLDSEVIAKGFLVQAKVNHRPYYGLAVDSRSRLNGQCRAMIKHTDESYVFAYGQQGTKVLKAGTLLTAGSNLSEIPSKTVGGFFGDVFHCWAGTHSIDARSTRELRELAREYEARSALLIAGVSSEVSDRSLIEG